jgi:hypothetical protein
MGALSRRKGAKYERVITNLLRCLWPEAKRGIGQERAGSEIADVTGVPRFWVQTKHGKFVSIRDALIQAEAELRESGRIDRVPLAIVRFDGESDIASMRLGDFLLLVAEHEYAMEIIDGAAPAYGLRQRLDNAMSLFNTRFLAALEK